MLATMSATELPVMTPRERHAGGCCAPLVEPDLTPAAAVDLAAVFKALADPTRLRIVDALAKSTPEALCQCELLPLFDMSQPAISRHLKLLVNAGVLGSERRGAWAYYYVLPDALKEVKSWIP